MLKKICSLYIDGFKNLTLGKVLWRVIFLKLAVIFLFLKIFIYDGSLSDLGENKGAFVLDNLTRTPSHTHSLTHSQPLASESTQHISH